MSTLEKKIIKASKLIIKSKKVIVMTGAGISVDSGVPTFQGTEGLWARFGKPKMNAYSDFLKNPESWWDREINHQRSPYVLELRKAIEGSKPNLGHKVLFEMENKNIINSVITQNIDGLHVDAGNKNVCEIHGNRNFLRCIRCDYKLKFEAPLIEGSKIIEINTNQTKLTNECDLVIKGTSTNILKKIFSEVNQLVR